MIVYACVLILSRFSVSKVITRVFEFTRNLPFPKKRPRSPISISVKSSPSKLRWNRTHFHCVPVFTVERRCLCCGAGQQTEGCNEDRRKFLAVIAIHLSSSLFSSVCLRNRSTSTHPAVHNQQPDGLSKRQSPRFPGCRRCDKILNTPG